MTSYSGVELSIDQSLYSRFGCSVSVCPRGSRLRTVAVKSWLAGRSDALDFSNECPFLTASVLASSLSKH